MATQVTVVRNSQTGTIGHEDYSLYSSMSEDELIQMAIEQSLTEDPAEQLATQKTVSAVPREQALSNQPCNHNPPFPIYPWQRHTAQSRGQTQPSSLGSTQGVRRRYDGSLFSPPQPEVPDPLVSAIKAGDQNALNRMIQSGKNLAQPNKDGWLPLHEAAYYGREGCLKFLHKSYPGTIDQRTLQEETPLYLATNRGNLDCVIALLQAGAEPDIASKSRETPLYKACERKNVEAVRVLLQYNADPNHRCNRGWTALHEAVSRNDLEIIDLLVKGGAKVEIANCYGITSLFVAAESGHIEALRYLAKCGAEINTQASDKATALYEASKNGHTKIVEFLLSQGADANKTNKDGYLPIHMASKKGYYEEFPLLVNGNPCRNPLYKFTLPASSAQPSVMFQTGTSPSSTELESSPDLSSTEETGSVHIPNWSLMLKI